jgi:hypothetical protein
MGVPMASVIGFPEQSETAIVNPCEKLLVVEWDRCNAGAPVGPKTLLGGGATSFWSVCRVHSGGSNVIFGEGHVKWMNPTSYHSNTDHIDSTGLPLTKNGEVLVVVAEEVWRKYWDTTYEQ